MIDEETTIYPTHECFDDAVTNLIYLMKRDGKEPVARGDLRIVHAIIAPDGADMAHAWLERGESVFFSGFVEGEKVLVECDRAAYYKNSVVKDSTKYTLFEAYESEVRCGHFGPWVERYRVLCSDEQKKREVKKRWA